MRDKQEDNNLFLIELQLPQLAQVAYLFVHQFVHLYNGNNSNKHFPEWLKRLNKLKYTAQEMCQP